MSNVMVGRDQRGVKGANQNRAEEHSPASSQRDFRYSKIARKMWRDEWFQDLGGALPVHPKVLWLYLLTAPVSGRVPGLFVAGLGAIGDDLGWSSSDVKTALEPILADGRAQYDAHRKVLFIPKAIDYNLPSSPNVVRSWSEEWKGLPACDAKEDARVRIREVLDIRLGPAFVAPFDKVTGNAPPSERKPSTKPFGKASPKPCPNQDQDQEHDQEQEQDLFRESSLCSSHPSRDPAPAHTRERADEVPKTDRSGPVDALAAARDLTAPLPPWPKPEDLLAVVRAHVGLAPLHKDQEWAEDAVGGMGRSGTTIAMATRAIADFVTAHSGEMRSMPAAELRKRLGAYLKNAKRHAAKDADVLALDPEVREAIDVFDKQWARAYREQRSHDADEAKHAAAVVKLAKDDARASGCKVKPREVFARAVREYLADSSKHVADQRHPLRLLAPRWSTYSRRQQQKLEAPPSDTGPLSQRAPAASSEPPAIPPQAIAQARSWLDDKSTPKARPRGGAPERIGDVLRQAKTS